MDAKVFPCRLLLEVSHQCSIYRDGIASAKAMYGFLGKTLSIFSSERRR